MPDAPVTITEMTSLDRYKRSFASINTVLTNIIVKAAKWWTWGILSSLPMSRPLTVYSWHILTKLEADVRGVMEEFQDHILQSDMIRISNQQDGNRLKRSMSMLTERFEIDSLFIFIIWCQTFGFESLTSNGQIDDLMGHCLLQRFSWNHLIKAIEVNGPKVKQPTNEHWDRIVVGWTCSITMKF